LSQVYRNFCFLLVCLPLLLIAPPAAAQSTLPPSQSGSAPLPASSTAPSNSGRLTIDVSVIDAKGAPVPGLTQSDFTLLDDRKPVPIASFQAFGGAQSPARPDEVAVVLDAVNLEFRYVGYARQQLDKFFRANEGRLSQPMSLFVTSDRGVTGLPQPTANGVAIADALDSAQIGLRFVGRSAGLYGADERFEMSLRMFMQIAQTLAQQPGRKLIVWIGPGWPLLNFVGLNAPSPQTAQQYFDAIVRISTVMRQNHITLDSISAGFPNALTFEYESFLKGVKSPDQANAGNLGEKVIAVESGGIVFAPEFDLPGDLQRCIDDASIFYRISFVPPPADKPDQYHSLEVRPARRGLKVLASTGYYGQP